MTHSRRLIEVCYESQLFFNLPTSSADLIDCAQDLLAALFMFLPTVVTWELAQKL
jgi:hypothetical protein